MRIRISAAMIASAIAVACAVQVAAAGPQSQTGEGGMREAPPPQPAPRLNETAPPPVEELEERAMEKPARRPPPRARGAQRAAGHAAVAVRGLWAELDANGDGRVSRAEGGADADFKANFEMLDADRDGFITEDEYRTHARTRHDDDTGRDPVQRDRR